MKKLIILILITITLSGCVKKDNVIVSALPVPSESVGLYLEAEPRRGKFGASYKTLCNVKLYNLNNLSIPIWKFPRVTYYAEQNGEFYKLREIETSGGGISRPYSKSGRSITLPRPPNSGKWRIFAIQEHSEIVYKRHIESRSEKFPILYIKDQVKPYKGMWIKPIVSNSIIVEFKELNEGEVKRVEKLIEGLIKVNQYRTDFKKPIDDPINRLN